MSELQSALKQSASDQSEITQAYFALFYAVHPETGQNHYFFMKGKDGNKLRIFGGEADHGGEGPLETILRETSEETDLIKQETGDIRNIHLHDRLKSFLESVFDRKAPQPIYSKEHDLTAEEIARGWHPSINHVYEIECDYKFLEELERVSAMAVTPEGRGTCLLSASEIQEIGAGCFRHPYESNSIGIHMFGGDVEEEFKPELI